MAYNHADGNAYRYQVMAWKFGVDPGLIRRWSTDSRKKEKYTGISHIEDRLTQILGNLGLNFERNQMIGKYEVDFLLEQHKLVIEANGRYFHNDQKDSRKANYLHEKGYRVIQIRGTDIMNHPKKVKKDIYWKTRRMGIDLGIEKKIKKLDKKENRSRRR